MLNEFDAAFAELAGAPCRLVQGNYPRPAMAVATQQFEFAVAQGAEYALLAPVTVTRRDNPTDEYRAPGTRRAPHKMPLPRRFGAR